MKTILIVVLLLTASAQGEAVKVLEIDTVWEYEIGFVLDTLGSPLWEQRAVDSAMHVDTTVHWFILPDWLMALKPSTIGPSYHQLAVGSMPGHKHEWEYEWCFVQPPDTTHMGPFWLPLGANVAYRTIDVDGSVWFNTGHARCKTCGERR